MTNKYMNRHHSHGQAKRGSGSTLQFSNVSAIFFGFLLGIFATCLAVFMFSTNDITLKIPTGSKRAARVASTVAPTPVAKVAAEAVQEPRYDFYTELAKNEVEPVSDLKSRQPTINGYIVQAGAFKKAPEADAVRAKLTLNGYTPKIEPVKQSSGEVLHKVLLGTFKNEQSAKKLQQQLKGVGVDSVLIATYANQ